MKTNPSPAPILAVLRKLAKRDDLTTNPDNSWPIAWIKDENYLTLGDCRKVKRWLERMENHRDKS